MTFIVLAKCNLLALSQWYCERKKKTDFFNIPKQKTNKKCEPHCKNYYALITHTLTEMYKRKKDKK